MSDSLALPITQFARQTAQEFGQQQSTPEKAQQVYLNTLAVCAVKNYFNLMDIPCNLEASDSWNPVIRLYADVADLVVTGIGRLECRPVLPQDLTCSLPPEVWLDRIGYVAVMIDESNYQARLLGFTTSVIEGDIILKQLQPLESLLAHLNEFRPAIASQSATDLGQWLQGIFEQGWQVVNDILQPSTPELAFNFRSAATTSTLDLETNSLQVQRAKLIQFQDNPEATPLVLIINLLKSEGDGQRMIGVQLRPVGNCLFLPANLVLKILDGQQTTFLEVQSRAVDNYIQLEFSGQPGEQFHLSLEQGEQVITEAFVM
ncbi:DUF1822 family protein [Acaryochloris sp. IP29b_bin.148]|uniref:DUF1822 family protein n=1 Tax=Acaryochloris sp. IP29b_bin.148 TaxID=2969218 RepID=UPI0026065F6E|nr:DUF1822 family protein [Acaryochloris sp. IP29b_bin.148]